jgi:hypothetical protein
MAPGPIAVKTQGRGSLAGFTNTRQAKWGPGYPQERD